MRKGSYTAILFSLAFHSVILLIITISQTNQRKIAKPINKLPPIKSYLYYSPVIAAPQLSRAEKKSLEKPLIKTVIATAAFPEDTKPPPHKNTQFEANIAHQNSDSADNKITSLQLAETLPPDNISDTSETANSTQALTQTSRESDNKKLDHFMQLQKLRSTLNQSAASVIENPYQRAQPPSIFNSTAKIVPQSVPLKEEETLRKKNTKNMGSGIAITKGEDGRCSVTQDLSAYGLRDGSSTQFFSCGETKFDKSFREHMKAVKAKLGKK